MAWTVDIIIVNWNSGDLVGACVRSLAALPAAERALIGRVVVVDNASADGSAAGLAAPPLSLTVLRNPVNRGFAAACNQGAAGSTAAALLFLNPDTWLYPGAVAVPVAELARPERRAVGLVGIRLENPDGTVARRCARFPTPARLAAQSVGLDRLLPGRFPSHFMTDWDHLSTREVDQPMGAFLLIRRPVFEALGGFDERFFVYYEDADLALRAHRSGWRSLYLAGPRAGHVGGGTTDRIRATRLHYQLRSRLQFACKHFSAAGAVAVTAATLIAEPAARLVLALARRDTAAAGQTLDGYCRLWGDLARRPLRILGAGPRPVSPMG